MAKYSMAKYDILWLVRHELDRFCWLLRMKQNSWLVFKIFIVTCQSYVRWYPVYLAFFPVYVILKAPRNFLVFICGLIKFDSVWCLNLGSYAFSGWYVQTKMNAWRGRRALKTTRSGNADERTMVWTEMHESLDLNARKSGERTMVWTWTHESLDMNAR